MKKQLIFKQDQKGLYARLEGDKEIITKSGQKIIKKGNYGPYVYPDRNSKLTKSMVPGEYLVTLTKNKGKFYLCVPIEKIEPDLSAFKKTEQIRKPKPKKNFQFYSKQEQIKLNK